MKRLLLIAFLLTSCGQSDSIVDISMTSVVWEGSLNDDPLMLHYFNETAACLSLYGYSREGYPHVIIVADKFYCWNETGVLGCVVPMPMAKTIYLQQNWSCNSALNNSCTGVDVIKEEIIHWITQKGDAYFSYPFFQNCL